MRDNQVVVRALGAVLMAAAVGCGAAPADESTSSADDSATIAKAGSEWVTLQGALGCGQTRGRTTAWRDYFDGYTYATKAGQKVSFAVTSNKVSYVTVYAPKVRSRWGRALRTTVIASRTAGGFTGALEWTAPADGTYLVVVGTGASPLLSYTIAAQCSAPHCVEYVTTDDAGASLRNFYAINVDSVEAGKAHLGLLNGNFVEEAIRPGTCASQSTVCPLTFMYAPVCGDIAPDDAGSSTYDSVCAFKAAVRTDSGAAGRTESKGHWEAGACEKPVCLTFRRAQEGFALNQYYAYNFVSYDAAKAHLAARPAGSFVEEQIRDGACSAQSAACPEVMDPVCATFIEVPSAQVTYGNTCHLLGAVMMAAGSLNKATASWTAGGCPK